MHRVRERPRYIVEAVLEDEAHALHRRAEDGRCRKRRGEARPGAGARRRPSALTSAVVFAYSEVGLRCVRELLAQGVEIPLLFTHADDPGESRWFGSVRQLAEARGLRVETPDDPNTPQWLAAGAAAAPDFLFSFYYRHLLDRAWLDVPKRGALNMHGSLLPKYRGAGAGALGHPQGRARDRRQPALHGGEARCRCSGGSRGRAHPGK